MSKTVIEQIQNVVDELHELGENLRYRKGPFSPSFETRSVPDEVFDMYGDEVYSIANKLENVMTKADEAEREWIEYVGSESEIKTFAEELSEMRKELGCSEGLENDMWPMDYKDRRGQ